MKVGWIVTSERAYGNSSRCIAFTVHDWLLKNGIDSEVIFAPEGEGGCEVPLSPKLTETIQERYFSHIVFQKVCLDHALYYLQLAKQMGITTVYTIDDYLEPYDKDMVKEADILIANSQFMQNFIREKYQKTVFQIPAAYEIDRNFCKTDYHTDQFTVFWTGSLANAYQGAEFITMMKDFGYKYELIAPPSVATIPWRLDYYNDLIRADVAVFNCFRPMGIETLAKGEGRPVQSMILGVPTIVSPFPSYAKLITNGVDGFVCYMNTPEEFHEYLEYLQDEKVRESIGMAGRQRVIDEYHIDAIGKRWLEAMEA